jgi:hypothetical protein
MNKSQQKLDSSPKKYHLLFARFLAIIKRFLNIFFFKNKQVNEKKNGHKSTLRNI